MNIFVKRSTGETLMINVDPSDSIYSLKEKIREKDGVPVEQQCLSFGGKELEDGQTLSDYNIQEKRTISLKLLNCVFLDVIINSLHDKIVRVCINPSSSIKKLKEMIHEITR